MQPVAFPLVFEELARPEGASAATVRRAFDAILAGAWTPVEVAGFAVALRLRGETAEVITAAAEALRSVMHEVRHGLACVVDTCGTGGDGHGTINVSTAAALVVAAARVPVAKHGNRSVSSRAGSADVLEALGVPLDVPPEKQAGLLQRVGIAFLFAPAHHPAMRHGGVARRELKIRTVFNAIGPLANPARATHQVIGTYDHALRPIVASALAAMGTARAWIVRGEDGLDEVSPFGPTFVTELSRGATRELVLTPASFGLAPSPPGALAGGDPAANAERLRRVLGGEDDPANAAIAMNAAAALVVAREQSERALPAATEEALELLRSGAALALLDTWRALALEARRP